MGKEGEEREERGEGREGRRNKRNGRRGKKGVKEEGEPHYRTEAAHISSGGAPVSPSLSSSP